MNLNVSEKPLSGKVAVVTGSTGGLGEGIARRLAAAGAAVVISGRRQEEGETVARRITSETGAPAIFTRCDVSQERDCLNLVKTCQDHFGRLDILVNNAAAIPVEPDGTQSVELWDDVFAVNTRGPFLLCRESIPLMREQGGGRIVNIGTTLVYRGHIDRLAYCCSKGALLTMTKVLARGLAKDHITVNWVMVGWVATPQEIVHRDQTHGDGKAYLAQSAGRMPMGELETVDDIAEGVAFLCSPQASHVTGCEFNISGGAWV
jgi:NAD(P)-dependent dehydrogenase (short-subunit alcohol dehydrogenase family)